MWKINRIKKTFTIKIPFEKTMYAEYTDEHFKFYAPMVRQKMFINIYAKAKDTPIVFKALMEKYMKEEWLDELSAAKKARDVVDDFFTICKELSDNKQYPFKIRITSLDPTKIKKK